MRKVAIMVLVLLLALPSISYADWRDTKVSKPWNSQCSSFLGFLGCSAISSIAMSCALPWGDCHRRLRDNHCAENRDRAMQNWREAQARGIQGPPPPEALQSC